jgi:hypothetical protein
VVLGQRPEVERFVGEMRQHGYQSQDTGFSEAAALDGKRRPDNF